MKRTAGGFLAACLLLAAVPVQADEPPQLRSLAEAEAYWHALLVARPDLPLPRLELARVYFLQGRDDLAREHFERVLAANPPPVVAANINHFLNRIRARRKWTASFGFAIAADSNLEGKSDETTFKSPCKGILILVCKDGIAEGKIANPQPTSGTGLRVWSSGEYQHPLSNRIRLRLGGRVDRTEYESSDFDKMTLSAHLGPRWLLGPRSEASLLVASRRHYIADQSNYLDLGLRLEAHHRLDQQTVLRIQAERMQRSYDRSPAYDGPLTRISAGISRVLTPTLRADAELVWSAERPGVAASRNRGLEASAGLSVLLPGGLTISGRATLVKTRYEGTRYDVFDESDREDETRSLTLSLHRRDLTIFGFSPEVSIHRQERTSNAQLAGYRRTSGNLGFVRPF